METQTELLVQTLKVFNGYLEKNGLVNVIEGGNEDTKNELVNELIRLVELLLIDIDLSTFQSFSLCYLHLLLGKKLNLTKTVDLLSSDINALNNIKHMNKGIFTLLVSNLKGRLRRLSPYDSKFHILSSTLTRLGSKIPNDVAIKIKDINIVR